MRQNPIQTSWTKGEVSPLARGRVDVNLYAMGADQIENLIVRPQGPLFRRSGTKKVHVGKLAGATRLIPFTVSAATAYQLEFGDKYIRIHRNKERLLEQTTRAISSYTIETDGGLARVVVPFANLPVLGNGGSFGSIEDGEIIITAGAGGKCRVFTTTPHRFRTGAKVYMRSNLATNNLDGNSYSITRIDEYYFDLDGSVYVADQGAGDSIAVFSHGLQPGDRAYIQGGENTIIADSWVTAASVATATKFTIANVAFASITDTTPSSTEVHCIPIEILSPYATADIDDIRFCQSSDVLYLFHPSYATRKLVRVSQDGDLEDWSLSTIAWTDGPYLPLNDLAPTIDQTTPANGTKYFDAYLESQGYTHAATVTIAPVRITSVANDGGGNYIITSAAHNLNNGDLVVIAGTGTTADGNRVVANKTDDTFKIGTAFGSASSTGTFKSAFKTTDDYAYIEYRQDDQWRLAMLPGTIADYDVTATVTVIDNVLLGLDESVRLNSRAFRQPILPGSQNNTSGYHGRTYNQREQQLDPKEAAQTDAASSVAGILKSQFANTFGQGDVGKFIRYTNDATATVRWAQIKAIKRNGETSTDPNAGRLATHTAACTMASNSPSAKFVVSNHARTSTVRAFRAAAADFSAFASTDVGRSIRLGFSGRWVWGLITAYTSASVVTVTWREDMPRDVANAAHVAGAMTNATTPDTGAGFYRINGAIIGTTNGRSYDWRLGAWSATTGYPSVGVFHEQRLWLGATTTQPQTFWGSISGDFENMMPTESDSTVLDDSAITYTLGSTQANPIQWMVSGPAMHIGTTGGEWQVRASDSVQSPLTPSNIKATEYTNNGSVSDCRPSRVGSAVLFVDRSRSKLYKAFYAYEKDAVDADDLSVISEHIMRVHGGAVASEYQAKPHSLFWIACGDGTLSCMTYNEKQEVLAWHHHTIQGGLVEDLSVIPSSDGTEDELWLIVNRSGTRYVEVIESDYYPTSSSSRLGMRFPDAHVVVEDFGGTTIKGLDHLEGSAVVVVSNGVRLAGTFTVTAGAITIAAAADELVIGLNGNADLLSLPPEGGSQFGTSQGQIKRIVSLDLRLMSCNGFSHGTSSADLIAFTLPVTAPAVWFTGTERVKGPHGYSVESPWFIRQPNPYPLNILFAVTKVETNE